MPLTHEFDNARRWVRVQGHGVVGIGDIVSLITSARAGVEHRMWPMLVDAIGATTSVTQTDVDDLAALVKSAVDRQGPRGHVAIAADDDTLYQRMLSYETKCSAAGVNVIRVFRQAPDAERWLDIVSAARNYL